MPRAGLAPSAVTEAGAVLADEVGYENLTMGLVAERLGVKTPSLYKHVQGLDDLIHRIAVLATTELGDAVRDATQGRADRDALIAAAQAMRTYVKEHPGRYAVVENVRRAGADDPIVPARNRLLGSFAAVLRGYHLDATREIHALRMLRSLMRGFATLELADGYQMDVDVDDSFTWMITFIDQGLRASAVPTDIPSGATL